MIKKINKLEFFSIILRCIDRSIPELNDLHNRISYSFNCLDFNINKTYLGIEQLNGDEKKYSLVQNQDNKKNSLFEYIAIVKEIETGQLYQAEWSNSNAWNSPITLVPVEETTELITIYKTKEVLL